MKTGEVIADRIAQMDTKKAVIDFINQCDENPEGILVGVAVITNDLGILIDCDNAEDFKKAVLDKAEARGHYAGLEYDENEFLDPDDVSFQESDSGLSWVPFADVWQALTVVY